MADRLFPFFLRFFLPLALLVGMAAYVLGTTKVKAELDGIKNQETLNVGRGAGALTNALSSGGGRVRAAGQALPVGVLIPTFNSAGSRLYMLAGRDNNTIFSDIAYYDLASSTWSVVTPSLPLTARYDASVAVRNDTLYVGGGATSPSSMLGDLWRIDGLTGNNVSYGNVLPLGALPSLSFDDHGEGLVYGGGYYGSTWYADVWTVRFQGSQVVTSFVRNFGVDGMVATPNYAVVADLYHGMFWGIPGYNAAVFPQDIRFLRDGVATVIKVNDVGDNTQVAARSVEDTTGQRRTLDVAPQRQFMHRRTAPPVTTIRATRGAVLDPVGAPR